MEQSKISAMMDGKTLTKENISKMYQMVQNASDAEEKKNVMKHSFCAGTVIKKENHTVDLPQTERALHLSVPYEELDDCMEKLLEGLSTQTLLLKKEDGSYEVNTKYEKSVLKVRKIARAYQARKVQEKSLEEEMPKAKKMYQMGTKYYHAGDYPQAAGLFYAGGGTGGAQDGLLQPCHDVQ